jgi:glycosyltransferase involved in cell wall biosynthesis
MRVLQVIPYFNQRRGGDVSACYNLSREIAGLGHDVVIATTDFEFDSNLAESIADEGVEVVTFGCRANALMFLWTPSMKDWLRNRIPSVDVVHLHDFRTYQNCVSHHYAVKNRVPYFLQAHGSLPRIVEKKTMKTAFDMVWGWRIVDDAEGVIAVSDSEVGHYVKYGVDDSRITVIPNGIDHRRFDNLPNRGMFRKRYSIGAEHIILYLGRVHRRKGLTFLLDSLENLKQRRHDFQLIIAGPDDGYADELRTLVARMDLTDHVRFIGYVENAAEAYRDADVLVYPATNEIFGMVPFEAILCGTPVIVTDDCGCGELISKVGCGSVVRYGDSGVLAREIELFIDGEKSNIVEMIDRGRTFIRRNLDWSVIAKQFEELYQNHISSRAVGNGKQHDSERRESVSQEGHQ